MDRPLSSLSPLLNYQAWRAWNNMEEQELEIASARSSQEQQIHVLEKRIQQLEAHMMALEALLTEQGILPALEESTAADAPQVSTEPSAPVYFPVRTEEIIDCPRCGRRQKGNRNACYSCGVPFLYRDELD